MAKRKPQTPADKAAAQIATIKEQVKSMVTGWQQRNVTREQWHEAHDFLADIYPAIPRTVGAIRGDPMQRLRGVAAPQQTIPPHLLEMWLEILSLSERNNGRNYPPRHATGG